MVNANVVISVSAILVAVILTIVFVLRAQGASQTNFSLSVAGNINGADAGMYYCIGDACQFYQNLPAGLPSNFPGYFALVGFVSGGSTFVTEHSIGKTFQFTNGDLVSCFDSTKLDSGELSAQVAGLKAAHSGDNTYTVDGDTFTMSSYSFSEDPALDSPTVLGFSVPSVEACRLVWGNEKDSWDFGPDGETGGKTAPAARRLDNEERTLWIPGSAQLQSGAWALAVAGTAYDNIAPAGATIWKSCVYSYPYSGSAVARFVYTGNTMAITFAGSNDAWDWILDLTQTGLGAPANIHSGFWKYVDLLQACVNSGVDSLWAQGIDIDMLIGHSLGGAAASVYRQLYGGKNGVTTSQLDTWAGPKTTRGSSCRYPGKRRFDEKDPVSGNGMGLMSSLNHDVATAQRAEWYPVCTTKVFGVCTWHTDTRRVVSVGCGTVSEGCDWVADCLYNVGRHMRGNYASFNW